MSSIFNGPGGVCVCFLLLGLPSKRLIIGWLVLQHFSLKPFFSFFYKTTVINAATAVTITAATVAAVAVTVTSVSFCLYYFVGGGMIE